MANELQAYLPTGKTLYAVLLNSIGQVWDGTQFETIAAGTWTDNDIALTEAIAGLYLADMPSVAAGAYSYIVYEQAGASPAVTDSLVGMGSIDWTGTAVLSLSAVKAETAAILAVTGTDGVVLTAAGVDAILDEVVVGSYTMRQLLTVMSAALAGKLSGGGTTTLTFRGIDDASNVIVATVDASNNRTALTITV